jgi:replication-associated recombination protein RarA
MNQRWRNISNLVEQMDLAEQVGRLYLKGKNETQIARELGMKRVKVVAALDDFRVLLRKTQESAVDVRERLLDIIYESDETFRMVVDEAWRTATECDKNGDTRNKLSALKLVESSTKNRADMLQKAGVSQDNDLVDQLNEQERQHGILIKLLKEIRDSHPEVAELIARRLTQVTNEVEVVAIQSGES